MNAGLPGDIPQLADLVRLTGPMTAPQVQVDAAASVAAIASVGAAFSTGGLSAIGQALFAKLEDGGATPCQLALRQKEVGASQGAPNKPAPDNPLNEFGQVVRRPFGK